MIFKQLTIPGAFVVKIEKRQDERGFLARTWDKEEFAKQGILLDPVQSYTCFTEKAGTLRGPHYVIPPHQDTKLVRVIRGSLHEVIIDLRLNSKTYNKWLGLSMKADDYQMVLTPPGCAHGIITLEDNTEYISLYSPGYDPIIERGIRHDDPVFNIKLPIKVEIISEKDKNWPEFKS